MGSKNSLLFLMPGIRKFSRKFIKGEHYYDCVSDVLKKVAAEPWLLEIDSVMTGNVDDECSLGTMSASQKEYLKPKVRPRDGSDLMRFMVVDTSMLHDGKRIRVRDLKSLPSDIDLGKEPVIMAGYSRIAISLDSSDSEDDVQSRARRWDPGSGKASEVNLVQTNIPQVDGVELGCSPTIDAVSNGHAETITVANDVEGHFGKFSRISKPKTHKYLSPVPKRRRLSGCKQQEASQKSLPFLKGNSNEAGNNRSVLSATADKGRESDHPQRKRKVTFLVKDVMKEETEPELGISGMVETVQGDPRAEPVPFHKPKEIGAGSTSSRKKKVRESKITENEPHPCLEMAEIQTKTEFDPHVQVTKSVKGAGATKRKRKMTNLFRESMESDNNSIPHFINGSEMDTDPTLHKPKKVIRRKIKPSVKEVKKEIELPSFSVTVHEVRQCETKEIEMPKPQLVKEESWDFNFNEPKTAPTDVGTSGISNAPETSEPNAVTSGRRVSTRKRPPTVRALEAVANGFLGGPKQRTVLASSRRARKSGEPSRRSRKMEETVAPIPSEDDNAVVLSAKVTGESSKGNTDQPIVELTGDIQPNVKTLDNVVKVVLST
jgi:hypothetical protein